MRDEHIVQSLLDDDFYKRAMGQMIFHKQSQAQVEFAFMNRTKSVRLGDIIDQGQLREELEHCRTLRYTPQELHYIMGTHEYDQPMFKIDYINFLKKFRLPDFHLGQPVDGQINLRFSGSWSEVSNWEILSMYIVNELYYRALTKGYSRFERERVEAEGRIRLAAKIEMLKRHPHIRFSDFGTRRRFSRTWQEYVVGVLAEEFPLIDGEPGQFLGTSNVYLAYKYGLMPMGTNAHELPMGYSGIYKDEDEEDPTFSSKMVIEDWESEYNKGLLLFLPDTFGSDWFFKNVVTPKRFASWRGSRQDSGIPIEYAEKRIKEYKAAGIDPTKKLIVFADGQTVPKMIDLSRAINGRIGNSYGLGTNLTNDVGFEALSIVTKPVRANGVAVGKLTDNIEKATGSPEVVARMKRMVGYTNTFSEVCKS